MGCITGLLRHCEQSEAIPSFERDCFVVLRTPRNDDVILLQIHHPLRNHRLANTKR